jgi:molybdopterin-guanine dinucleotide biosynthesis protein A
MVHRRAIVAVIAGGLGERLGGSKPSVVLGSSPLICHPLAAAAQAGLEAIVVAKPSTVLPSLDVRVLREPEQPRHPLCGLIAALRFAAARPRPPAVVAVACDMPFVTGPLLGWLAVLDGAAMAHVGGRAQPLLGRWPVGGLPLVAQALAEKRPLRSALAALEPAIVAEDELGRFGDPARLCFNVNDPADLRTARKWLAAGEP